MARPKINLENCRVEITRLFNENLTYERICEVLQTRYQITISKRTLKRTLQQWQLARRVNVRETQELRARIAYLFLIEGFNDDEILHCLQVDGHRIEKTALERIRRSQGLWRRLSVFERDQQEDQLRAIIQTELDEGEIEGYGRRLLHCHFKTAGVMTTRYELAVVRHTCANTDQRQNLWSCQRA